MSTSEPHFAVSSKTVFVVVPIRREINDDICSSSQMTYPKLLAPRCVPSEQMQGKRHQNCSQPCYQQGSVLMLEKNV